MAGKRRKEFDQNRALELYENGLGWRAIAKELGGDIHPYSIQFFFKSLGLTANKKVGVERSWDPKKAIQMYQEGMTYEDIAKEFGVTVNTIKRGIKKVVEDEVNV